MLFFSSDFFSKATFSKNSFRNTIRVSNRLDPDQNQSSVSPDLGPNCLQRLSADDKSPLAVEVYNKCLCFLKALNTCRTTLLYKIESIIFLLLFQSKQGIWHQHILFFDFFSISFDLYLQ